MTPTSATPATGGERTIVHLLRHGEVDNPSGVLYGRLPGFVLSRLGHQMAEVAAEHLAGRDICVIVSSPLERAQQTAAPSAAVHDLQVQLDERVIEAGNRFEGMKIAKGKNLVRTMRHDVRRMWWLRNPAIPTWGEPYADIAARMSAAIADARAAALGREALVVSHQLPVWVARLDAQHHRLAHDVRKRQCDLASVTSLTFEGDRVVDVSYCTPAADLVAKSNKGVGA